LAACLATTLGLASFATAGDWPQILGPYRNGTAEAESLAPWPSEGPETIWSHALGEGYAGPAVQGDRAVVFHRVGEVERAEALDARTGRRLWKADFPTTYSGGINPDTGPRCVPLIHKDRVFLFGAAGDLHCVLLVSGEKRWSRRTHVDFDALEGYFGAGSTPIIAGDKLLVNVGGRDDAGLVAFQLDTGRTVWQRTDERASYASPTRGRLGGEEHVVFVTRLHAMSVDPADGSVRFRFPFGRRGPTVNAATPLIFDDCLFVTASYGIGAQLVRWREGQVESVWAGDESMSTQYPTPVYYQGYLYGIHGREDIGVAELRCVEAKSGKVQWSAPGFGMAHLIRVENRLLLLSVDGRLTLAEATPNEFRSLATTAVSTATTRALPALAGGRLYLRENSGEVGALKCLRLAD
jgi:outer membrane protein assembly factor BamB